MTSGGRPSGIGLGTLYPVEVGGGFCQPQQCEIEAVNAMKQRKAPASEAGALDGVILESKKRQVKLTAELENHKAMAHSA